MKLDPIPPATLNRIVTPTPRGSRHDEAMKIAVPLIGNGMSDRAVFAVLRDKFEPDVTDQELQSVIGWVRRIHPEPSIGGNGKRFDAVYVPSLSQKAKRTPIEQVDWWTGGAVLTAEETALRSPVPIPSVPAKAAILALSSLYLETDRLNVVRQFVMDGEKAKPHGGGKTLLRDQWCVRFEKNGIPDNDAGVWFRLNPCSVKGTGQNETVTDADMVAFRFVLVESDVIPVEKQLAFYSKLGLPIAAMVLSGGGSVHAWVRVDCSSRDEYRECAVRLLDALKPFGWDQVNKNPSRLCRLPGAMRRIGCETPTEQRLVWLNPNVIPLTGEGLRLFEKTLTFPAVIEHPLKSVCLEAIDRYEWMRANVGKLGVPTGIPQLDALSGGFKKGQTIVVAGPTGGGKTTLALHHIRTALNAGIGVVLFSLEMDRDEIFDLLVSERTGVNRNKFNTGKFSDYDVKLMTDQFGTISNLPLYIEDSALSGVEQIQDRVWQLKTDSKIGLVVVDYIQFVNPGLTRENREQQIAGISHGLRSLARETQLPMIVLSQLNDEGKLRESRVIAHNANVVMMVEIQPGGRFRVSVTKGRGIPCGDYFLTFDALFARLIPDPVSLPDSSTDSYRHEQSVPATLDVPRTLVSDSLLL